MSPAALTPPPTDDATRPDVAAQLESQRPSEAVFVHRVRRIIAFTFLTVGVATMALLVTSTDVVTDLTLTLIMLAVVALLAVTTLIVGKTAYLLLAVVAAGTAVASAWVSVPPDGADGFVLTAQWLLHACACAGLILSTRRAVLIIFPAALLALVSMLIVAGPNPQWVTVAAVLVICVDSVGISMGNNAAVTVWRRAALRRDAAVGAAIEAEAEAREAEAAVHARYRLRVRLHDTVLNLYRGLRSAELDPAAATAQAKECLRELDESERDTDPGSVVERLKRSLTAEARRLGLTVSVDARPAPTTCLIVPAQVYYGLQACARAALQNVSAHSGTNQATAIITETLHDVRVVIVDSGDGFIPRPGGPMSVERRAVHFGVQTTIASTIGHGTTVTTEWSPASADSTDSADNGRAAILNGSLAVATRRIVAWLGGAYLLETLLLPGLSLTSGSLYALLITAAIVGALLLRARPYPAPWIATIAATIAVPVVLTLVNSDYGVCTDGAQTFIGSGLAMLLVLSSMLLAPTRIQAMLPVAAYTIANGLTSLDALGRSADCGAGVTFNYITDLATLGVLLYVAGTFQRFVSDAQTSQTAEIRAIEEGLAARSLAAQLSNNLERAMASSRALITGIANGRLRVGDPALVVAVNSEERHLRNLLNVDSAEIGALCQPIRALADSVYLTGRNTRIHVIPGPWPPTGAPTDETAGHVGQYLEHAIAGMPPHVDCDVTIAPRQDVPVVLTATGPGIGEPPPVPDPLVVDIYRDDEQTEYSITWARP